MPAFDLVGLLEYLGLEQIRESNDEVYALCPMHFERMGYNQTKPHWSINVESGLHSCFSCDYKGGLIKLIADVQGCTRGKAESLVKKYGVDNFDKLEVTNPEPEKFSLREKFILFDDAPPEELAKRHLSEAAAAVYGLRWDYADFNGWVLPIRGTDGRLWGWQYKSDGFVSNYPPRVQKGRTLFGADLFERMGVEAILVESPLDAARLYSIGYSAVASFGAQVSDTQMSLLNEHAGHIILALDNDEAGLRAMDKLCQRWVSRTELYVANYAEGDPKDVGEMTDVEVRRVLATPISAWDWLEKRNIAQDPKGREGSLSVPKRSRKPHVRSKKASRGYGNGAWKDPLHHRRRRASHRSG